MANLIVWKTKTQEFPVDVEFASDDATISSKASMSMVISSSMSASSTSVIISSPSPTTTGSTPFCTKLDCTCSSSLGLSVSTGFSNACGYGSVQTASVDVTSKF
ncbi:hypothetical protein OIU76_023813 [Salix suchowensis]|nr:hypothetical protein OIU76_023813 [Salix suchowensis]